MDAGTPATPQQPTSGENDAQVILGANGQIKLSGGGDADPQDPVPQIGDGLTFPTDVPITTVPPAPTTSIEGLSSEDVPLLETPLDSGLPTSFFLAPTSAIDNFPSFLSIPTPSAVDSNSISSDQVSMAPSTAVSVFSATSLATLTSIAPERSSSVQNRASSSISAFSPSATPRSSSMLQSSSIAILSSSSQAASVSSSIASSKTISLSSISSFSASSLSTSHSPAVTTTVYAPALTHTASNLNVHSPPFYIGVILGALAGAACFIALIAWCLRRHAQARRRRAADMVVPWARSRDMEEGGGYGGGELDAAIGAMNLGSREDLAHVQAWSPRGDRDVGEPRRVLGDGGLSRYSLQDHLIPTHGLCLEDSLRSLSPADDVEAAPPLHPKKTLRQLPSHLVDEDLLARARRENVRHFGRDVNQDDEADGEYNPYLDPRGPHDKPRYLGLHGNGLDVPWNQKSAEPPPRSMAERLRNLGKPPAESPWNDFPPLPTPGRDASGEKEEFEPWAASFRTSLVNAFNAVAANISSTASVPKLSETDVLTAPPRRQSRKSIRSSVSNSKAPSSRPSLYSAPSKAWTLEEKEDGTGVVHILGIPELEKYGSTQRRPSMKHPTLSFGDGESISSYYQEIPDSNCHSQAQVPLVASSRPRPVLVRPTSWLGRRRSSQPSNYGFPSRRSSVYSKPSLSRTSRVPSVRQAPRLTFTRTRSLDTDEGGLDSIVIQPDTISRLSSSDSSTGDGGTEDGRSGIHAAAAKALQTRKRRVVNV
ncbi:unnamed protein product [Cyclocybe aegerita]|uniref:Uncharacterized protein n=1 Tax=Cyclocybe aegerita TaxID=1973307 RepID=A0A8S0W9J1_CYCAE|nr:unnamed protein product [Cyclocybe aegerita]